MGLRGAYDSNLRQWDGPGSANGRSSDRPRRSPSPQVRGGLCKNGRGAGRGGPPRPGTGWVSRGVCVWAVGGGGAPAAPPRCDAARPRLRLMCALSVLGVGSAVVLNNTYSDHLFPCALCNREFKSAGGLGNHLGPITPTPPLRTSKYTRQHMLSTAIAV
jgi:hypothetical protein